MPHDIIGTLNDLILTVCASLQLEDGTCTYVFQPKDAEPYKGTVGGFISQTLRCTRIYLKP